jgi:hypothetical protein
MVHTADTGKKKAKIKERNKRKIRRQAGADPEWK